MSDRLNELRRQRALQREHLEWLDREIASLEAAQGVPAEEAPPPILEPPYEGDPSGDDILEEFKEHPDSIGQRTKMGCLVYFLVAVGLLAIVLLGIHLFENANRIRH